METNQSNLTEKAVQTLEFIKIKEQLAERAVSQEAKEQLLTLMPFIDAAVCKEKQRETTEARKLLEAFGTPPLPMMEHIKRALELCKTGVALTAEQLENVATFLFAVRRMQSYLKRGELSNIGVSYYGRSFMEAGELRDQINDAIVNGVVSDHASNELKTIRKQIEKVSNRIKERLEQLLRQKKEYFSDSYVSVRNGHYVLPVKHSYKLQVPGTIIATSSSGSTLFVEPNSVMKLEEDLMTLQISEENEVQKILYTLTAMVEEYNLEITRNMETMTALDVVFAKAKLSIDQKAIEPEVNYDGTIRIVEGRHPLLKAKPVVPLNFSLTKEQKGIVITGPNTGGKTVSLKTVGLLSLMGRSGLHVPAAEGTVFTMQDMVVCDIGDGQSISQNLSTFSSHIKTVVAIVNTITKDSLVLLDELGSGTDPKEGMGIAIAILEKLRTIGCYFVATTHYPEVKDYAEKTEGVINASMAFDRETLSPLYQLKLNEAGESCALYIAKRLGFADDMLDIAKQAAYGTERNQKPDIYYVPMKEKELERKSAIDVRKTELRRQEQRKNKSAKAQSFGIGDSVFVYPKKEIGIVFQTVNEHGEIGVQIKKEKQLVSYKRLKLNVKSTELYPEDYDFSVVFDSVYDRKVHKKMAKGHGEGLEIRHDKDELQYK
ncbi:MAG: DNA mismatch repair protein MutS [bacterium]|nr:DNA mismatch repair protein MutS [bacterium]